MTGFAELHCLSNFSFLRAASHPEEQIAQAARLGYTALALTDECSVAGAVRAHVAAREHGVRLIVGSEFSLREGPRLVLLAANRRGYGQLCRFISHGRRATTKGNYLLTVKDLQQDFADCLALWLVGDTPDVAQGELLKTVFPGRLWLAAERFANFSDQQFVRTREAVAGKLGIRVVATNDVHMHVRGRRALQDTLTAIRHKSTVAECGYKLFANGERYLRPLQRLERIYPAEWLQESVRIADRCCFSLDELRYEYPEELIPREQTPASHLRALTYEGARWRWSSGNIPEKVTAQIEHELKLIADLEYEPFFLTVHDVVRFARERGILCQGRGSAANSLVCYCLGITSVGPERTSLLFERFISRERDEPPDIDVDFEHERREEVIQYIYEKYGRERAALAATVITYRPRSAVRDVGKALGFSPPQVEKLAKAMQWWDGKQVREERVREAGFDPGSPMLQRLLVLVNTLVGFPRHLSQHVGGFVISRGPLAELVPVENAAMPERTIIQWDKNDLEALGLLKVDVLGLGMLTAIRRCFDLVEKFRGKRWDLATVPEGDPAVYRMIQRADTVGVFQIESRAQMSMLPRLQPRNYYDLVIQVAIVRPGPIQGNMVHPYLARRAGREPVTYPKEELAAVLHRTLGVPIFQEQAMQISMVAAGFTPGEADQLRRAMAAWSRRGGLEPFRERLISGMLENGYQLEFAEQIYNQVKGFGDYGFPESHAASFALLAYVSSWLKFHEPAAFCAALLNSQPMGFYAPAQLVQDARRHGVKVLPADVACSEWDCTLERDDLNEPVLRLGLRMLKGFSGDAAERLVTARAMGSYRDVHDLMQRANLSRRDMETLAAGGALASLSGNRHQVRWQVAGVEPVTSLFKRMRFAEGVPMLRQPEECEDVIADYANVGLTLRTHPVGLVREHLNKEHIKTARELADVENGSLVTAAGLVINRQRPSTAQGVTFMTLEDETGHVNVIVWRKTAEAQRKVLLGARLMAITGYLQRQENVTHLVAAKLEDYSHLLKDLQQRSRDFH